MRAPDPAIELLTRDPRVGEVCRALLDGAHSWAVGASGSSTHLLAGAVARRTGRLVVLVTAHLDDADEAVEELECRGIEAWRMPALEVLPGETALSLELFAERIAAVRRLAAYDSHAEVRRPERGAANADVQPRGSVLVCPVAALMQGVPEAARIPDIVLELAKGDSRGPQTIVRWLDAAGFRRTETIAEAGDYSVRGGILDVFPPGAGEGVGAPLRLDFFGDELESIAEIDLASMTSDRKVERAEVIGARPELAASDHGTVNPLESVPLDSLVIISETQEVTEQARGYYDRVVDSRGVWGPPAVFKLLRERFAGFCEVNQFSRASATARVIELPVTAVPEPARDAGEAVRELAAMSRDRRVVVCCQNDGEAQRLGELLSEFGSGGPATSAQVPDADKGTKRRAAKQAGKAEAQVPPGKGSDKVPGKPPAPTGDDSARPGRVETDVRYLHRGFVWGSGTAEEAVFLPYHELLHRYQTRRRFRKMRGGRAQETFLSFEPGDFVVHVDHGIARYLGLVQLKPKGPKATAEREAEERLATMPRLDPGLRKGAARKGAPAPRGDAGVQSNRAGGSPVPPNQKPRSASAHANRTDGTAVPIEVLEEYLTLEFAGGDKLHVPVTQIDKVQKYVGGHGGKPPLSTLGGKRWQNQKDSVSRSVRDLAAEMLRIQAARQHSPGLRFPDDTAWQREFEAEFPYEETEDQLTAAREIKQDMIRTRPMDRLLCGDVGFGKTEVAMRAAFKAVEFGKQVAVLVPTTLLAEQHERTFRQRFAGYPFVIESVSRFKSPRETGDILARTRKGGVDVLIGTHRLLSKDVRFNDLGLVVIDEEQRFGVEHKQALLAFRMTADVLTLSATPIPRTLHMAMLGLRDISSLTTAPMDRRAVVTEVFPFNEARVKRALDRELSREGQVFFVHNRVHDIRTVADRVQALAPGARIVIGHGQMPDEELEEVMRRFIRRDADVLVSTTIIESGIDIPTANTMFIHNADQFGLSELHQLRGRVGRYKHRAYCYLLLPEDRPVTDIAMRRLRAVEEFSMLGAGFKIAMRDLEIRGAGNLLGAEQSGHIAAVGYDMYCRLLERAAQELRHERIVEPSETVVDLGLGAALPRVYIPSDTNRLDAYRRIATARSFEELATARRAMEQAYGGLPRAAERLFDLAAVRIAASAMGVKSVVVKEKDVIFRVQSALAPQVQSALAGAEGTVRVLPPATGDAPSEVYFRPPPSWLGDTASLLTVLRRRLAPDWGRQHAESSATSR